jgi:transcriptional regulator with XRE-family HTH domain
LIYFSSNLKYLRLAKGLKQNELAGMIDVKTNTISNYENGISEPDFKILDLIVKTFDVKSSDLLFTDLSSQSAKGQSYIQNPEPSDIVSEPPIQHHQNVFAWNCKNCADKERIIKAQQITIDELRIDKNYLKDEIRALKNKLGSIEKE